MKFSTLSIFINVLNLTSANPTPTVMWHGLGDYSSSFFSMGHIQKLIERNVKNVYVYSVCVPGNRQESCTRINDIFNGFIGNVKTQILQQCDIIRTDERLMTEQGFNLLGFSQGGLFSRALVQLCPDLKIRNVISIGGPQNGVFGFPGCDTFNFDDPEARDSCEAIRVFLNNNAVYRPNVQNYVVPAQYWHDAFNSTNYGDLSKFLAEVNQVNSIDQTQVEALSLIDNLVLTAFTKDQTIIPWQSEWFGFYEDGQDRNVVPMNELPIFKNLGLDKLYSEGKLTYYSLESGHLSFSDSWFVQNIVEPFLDN